MFSAANLGNFDFLEFPKQTSLLDDEDFTQDTLLVDDGFEMPAVGNVRQFGWKAALKVIAALDLFSLVSTSVSDPKAPLV